MFDDLASTLQPALRAIAASSSAQRNRHRATSTLSLSVVGRFNSWRASSQQRKRVRTVVAVAVRKYGLLGTKEQPPTVRPLLTISMRQWWPRYTLARRQDRWSTIKHRE